MDRPLPQNLDAERGLLGILLEVNDELFNVSHLLGKADFMEPFHGDLYTLLRDLIETGREAKPATVMHDLAQDRDIGGIHATAYLHQLLADAPNASMAKTFARTIRDLAMRRRLIGVALQHVDEAYSAPATISALEIENRYHAAASVLFGSVQDAGMSTLNDAGMAVIIDTQNSLKGDVRRGLSSGLKALDDLWGPLLPGRLYSIAGASGSGKTALAWQIARHVGQSQSVLFASLEMDKSELAARDLTFLSGLPSERIESAELSVDEFQRLVEAQEQQKQSLVVIDSAKGQTVGGIRGKALRLKRLKGLALLVVDHWRYLVPSSRVEEFQSMNNDLRAINAIADDLEIPVILLAQFKSGYASEPKIRDPNLGDIYNGAVLEQESDALLLVHRLEYLLQRRKPTEAKDWSQWELDVRKWQNKALLILNKRRGGIGYGQRTVGFDGPTTSFSDRLPKADIMEPALQM